MNEGDFKTIGIIVGSISGAIGLAKLVVTPVIRRYRTWRHNHPRFRSIVLRTLKELQIGMDRNDDYNAALLRERLESAYTVYVLQMGWCPSGEKRMLMDLFDLYIANGWNHINKRYKETIDALPEERTNERIQI